MTGDGDITIVEGGLDADGRPAPGAREIARVPASALTSDAIVHQRVAAAPTHRRGAPAPGAPDSPSDRLPERGMDPGAVLVALLGSAGLASRHAVYHQYDSTVGADTVAGPGRGAAVLRVKGTTKALVATTDGNHALGALDPWLGAAMAVAEATRNVSITGARPLGVTNCLNYGDPTRPEAFWQLSEGVRGLGDACRALGLPVTGGNVSLYNESSGGAIAPTAEIGVVGLLEDVATLVGPAFVAADDAVVLIGEPVPGLAGSAYAQLAGAAVEDEPPSLDLADEVAVQAFIREAIARGLVASAQDVSGGGLAVAIAEGAMWGGLGASLRVSIAHSPAVDLFGEGPSRLVVTCRPRHAAALTLLARQHGRHVETLGTVGGDRLVIELAVAGPAGAAEERGSRVADTLDVAVADLRHAWDHGLARALGWEGRTPDVRRVRSRAARWRADRGRVDRRARPVRAPAPRPGIGRAGGQRRRAADALQGPRDDQLGARRAPAAEPSRPAWRSPTAATRRPARRSGRTPSRPTGWAPAGRSPSATTATSINTRELLTQLRGGRSRLPASTDTELLTALIADEPAADTVEALQRVLPRVRGAYSLVILDERRVIGVRDPFGFRPLVLGSMPGPIAGDDARQPACGRATTRRSAGACRPRPPRSTSSAPTTSATSSPARWSSSSPARRRARSASPRRPLRCACSS